MNNLSEWLCISSIQQRSYSKYTKPKDIFSWAMQRSYSYLVVGWSVQKNLEQDFDNREKTLNNYHITIYSILYNDKVFISIFANHFVDFHLFSWAPQLVNLTYELIVKNRLEMETLPCILAPGGHWQLPSPGQRSVWRCVFWPRRCIPGGTRGHGWVLCLSQTCSCTQEPATEDELPSQAAQCPLRHLVR